MLFRSRHWLSRGLVAIEALVRDELGPFALGAAPTLADVCIVPQLYHARRFGVDVAACPSLLRIEAACEKLDAFAAAHAERQPDAPAR